MRMTAKKIKADQVRWELPGGFYFLTVQLIDSLIDSSSPFAVLFQDRELRQFKEQQKQELKMVRVEVEMLPRDQRKEATRRIKEQKERQHIDQVHFPLKTPPPFDFVVVS